MLPRTETTKQINVLIADDHPLVRGGLRTALSGAPDICVVGESSDGQGAEEQAVLLNPDILIMDIYMPNRDGLEAMVRIKKKLPGIKVIFLTVSEHENDLMQAIRFGADGYLLKKCDITEVVGAVRRVASGEAVLSPRIASRVMKELRETSEVPSLSAREQQVMDLLTEGLTNAEIAVRLTISAGTVNTYVYRLLQKLHLKNRAEAIAFTIQHRTRREPY